MIEQHKWVDTRTWLNNWIALDPHNADAHDCLGYLAWAEWYPSDAKALSDSNSQPDTGPLKDAGSAPI
jgi:hypothetical protein